MQSCFGSFLIFLAFGWLKLLSSEVSQVWSSFWPSSREIVCRFLLDGSCGSKEFEQRVCVYAITCVYTCVCLWVCILAKISACGCSEDNESSLSY